MKAPARATFGLALTAIGVYFARADDAPGAAVLGLLFMVSGVVLGVRAARHQLATWAARSALAAGVVVAALAAFLIHRTVVTAPLFSGLQEVPSVVGSAPSANYAAAVERAREAARAAILEQNLPGLSVAVGADGTIVWAEGFGWRDVGTGAPMTPDTRFIIGTAAPAVADGVAALGLAQTGTEAATAWSPEATGEEGEDFPLFTLLRHVIWQPLGFMAAEYPLPADRATFYVPRSGDDPRRGRRLMYMRDLACCAEGLAFYSTPSDLIRVALTTRAGNVNGELAGGPVMSLTTRPGSRLVVAVASNIAHAKTSALALRIRDTLAE